VLTGAVLREVWFDRVWRVNACRVVEDGPERLVLHFPRGAPARFPVDASGREVRIPMPDGWTLAERVARRDGLAVFRPGARHSVWLFWNDDGSLAYWYVNFEEPLRRTALGLDIRDEKLDLVVEPGGAIRWKDEDELAEAAARGLVDGAAVRAEAARVLAAPPWPTGWEDWRPDAALGVPQLPEGWERVNATSPGAGHK
jgi:hypothetical protein